MSYVTEFTVGDGLKSLQVTIRDGNDNPVNITGATVKLIGKSSDIATALSITGAVTDGPNGVCSFSPIGTAVTLTNMGSRRSALYNCQVVLTQGGADGYSDFFQLRFRKGADQ